ncbi:MAG: 2OG-Fe(II) oxygenase [Alphaproteobacteria bacterium]|nr:2OG-Fe(II) oxygenase [Alphaproteobacteria bacterium]
MAFVRCQENASHGDALLNLDALKAAPVTTEPFPYMAASNAVESGALRAISADFPPIDKPGVFPLSEIDYGGAFAQLIEDVQGADLEVLLEEKFGMSLSDKPLMITVRGMCQKKDGRIHTDSKDKILTCLLYLNDAGWSAEGGRLRLLRDGRDLDSTIAEIPPDGGNFVAFKRTDHSWHGHAPFEGPRRYIMFNWVRSDLALAKNIGRHKLSAAFKRMGIFDGY